MPLEWSALVTGANAIYDAAKGLGIVDLVSKKIQGEGGAASGTLDPRVGDIELALQEQDKLLQELAGQARDLAILGEGLQQQLLASRRQLYIAYGIAGVSLVVALASVAIALR